MAVKTIERSFPGKTADQLYVEVEKVLRGLGQKHGIACQFHPEQRRVVVPETMGVKGLCTVADGKVKVDLEHGLLGTAVVGTVKSYIEQKLEKLFT
jgi:putative polyhydroxyalkanoate system protein